MKMEQLLLEKNYSMKEQLISFETAVLAKQKGFNIPQSKRYTEATAKHFLVKHRQLKEGKIVCANWGDKTTETQIFHGYAPTQSLLQKWLREVHDIHVYCSPESTVVPYYQVFVNLPDNDEFEVDPTFAMNYEEALERGLFEALKCVSNER
jgi:hypothetical protein